MITPDDIRLTTALTLDRNGKEGPTEVRAGLQVHVQYSAVDGHIEYAKERCKFEVWHGVYGNLEARLNELRWKAHQALSMPAAYSSSLDKEICDLIEMVKNPFC